MASSLQLDVDRLHSYWLNGGVRSGRRCGSTYAMLVDAVQKAASLPSKAVPGSGLRVPVVYVLSPSVSYCTDMVRMIVRIGTIMGYNVIQERQRSIVIDGGRVVVMSVDEPPQPHLPDVLMVDHSVEEKEGVEATLWEWEHRIADPILPEFPTLFFVGGIPVAPIGISML